MTEGEEAEADIVYEHEYTDISSKHNAIVEPVYIELIMNSRMNMASKDTFFMMDHIFDQQKDPIEAKRFYLHYVSKSLPCVFKNELVENKVFIEIGAKQT